MFPSLGISIFLHRRLHGTSQSHFEDCCLKNLAFLFSPASQSELLMFLALITPRTPGVVVKVPAVYSSVCQVTIYVLLTTRLSWNISTIRSTTWRTRFSTLEFWKKSTSHFFASGEARILSGRCTCKSRSTDGGRQKKIPIGSCYRERLLRNLSLSGRHKTSLFIGTPYSRWHAIVVKFCRVRRVIRSCLDFIPISLSAWTEEFT